MDFDISPVNLVSSLVLTAIIVILNMGLFARKSDLSEYIKRQELEHVEAKLDAAILRFEQKLDLLVDKTFTLMIELHKGKGE